MAQDFPGPTAYEVSRAFEALTTQRRKPPRSKQAFRRQTQFLTASKRTFAGEVNSDTPGPGAYDTLISSRAHGFAPLHENRFQREESQGPGPATYEVNRIVSKELSTSDSICLVVTITRRYCPSWNF